MGLPALLLAYTTGLFFGPWLQHTPAALSSAALLLGSAWILLRAKTGALVLLLLFFVCFGLLQYQRAITPPKSVAPLLALAHERKPVIVEGRVLRIQSRPDERSALDIETSAQITAKGEVPITGRLRLTIDDTLGLIMPGQRVRFLSRIRIPQPFGTPGEFDYPRHLAAENIFVTAYLEKSESLVIFAETDPPSLRQRIEGLRLNTGRFIDQNVDPSQAALVKALIIGDKGNIKNNQQDLLARSGVSHLFAISGMHLGLLAALLYLGARALYRRNETLLLLAPPGRVIPVLLIPFLCFYLFFTGASISTIRAFIMVATSALLLYHRRATTPLGILAAVAFILLGLYPLSLYQPAFQLSFAGVLGILVLTPKMQKPWRRLPGPMRYPLSLSAATLAATLTTTPLVLWHFHLAAPAGLLANLPAIPLIGCAAVPLGLAGALAVPFHEGMASLLLNGCALSINLALKIVAAITALPHLGGWRVFPAPWHLLFMGAAVVLILLPLKSIRCRLAFFATLTAAGFVLALLPSDRGALKITALSVGQGDALVLCLPGGKTILMDGGGLYSPTFDVGERLVAPALGRMGISHLDAVMLTHDHPDHRKGLVFVLNNFPVTEFWSPKPLAELDPDLIAAIESNGIPVRLFPPGWNRLETGPGTTLALHRPSGERGNENNRSQILYLQNGADGVLLTGDLEAEGVSALLSMTLPGPVNLLKLPHHGSKGAAPEKLAEQLHPQMAFVSVGRENNFGLPHPQVVEMLGHADIPLFRTDLQGTLSFTSRGNGWQKHVWKKGP